jgi:hypothetical protein
MGVLRKRDTATAAGLDTPEVEVCELALTYPGMFEFLTATQYGIGEVRKPGTITLFLDAGGLKACVNDRDQGMTAFATGESLAALLDAVERGLQGDTLDWRRATPPTKRRN